MQSLENVYFGRQRVGSGSCQIIIPGYVVPATGLVHSGFYKEHVSPKYEVLCYSEPCSLLYLAGKVNNLDELRQPHSNVISSTMHYNYSFLINGKHVVIVDTLNFSMS